MKQILSKKIGPLKDFEENNFVLKQILCKKKSGSKKIYKKLSKQTIDKKNWQKICKNQLWSKINIGNKNIGN